MVTRLARHRLKPCRGDTAECCHKATRRSQGSWSRVIRPRRQASGCLSARCTCGEAVRSPDERSEELCEAKSQEGAREPRRDRKGPSHSASPVTRKPPKAAHENAHAGSASRLTSFGQPDASRGRISWASRKWGMRPFVSFRALRRQVFVTRASDADRRSRRRGGDGRRSPGQSNPC